MGVNTKGGEGREREGAMDGRTNEERGFLEV